MAITTRAGDALQEPFWPEGLGINRGLMHVYDTADLARGFGALLHSSSTDRSKPAPAPLIQQLFAAAPEAAATGAPPPLSTALSAEERALLRRREELFALSKVLSVQTRKRELRPFLDTSHRFTFSSEPQSRYTGWSAQTARSSMPSTASKAPPAVVRSTGGRDSMGRAARQRDAAVATDVPLGSRVAALWGGSVKRGPKSMRQQPAQAQPPQSLHDELLQKLGGFLGGGFNGDGGGQKHAANLHAHLDHADQSAAWMGEEKRRAPAPPPEDPQEAYARKLEAAKREHAEAVAALSPWLEKRQSREEEEQQMVAVDEPESDAAVPNVEQSVRQLFAHLTAPCASGGALSRLQNIGSVCERLGHATVPFFAIASEFVRHVEWEEDPSCGDIDVMMLLSLIAQKAPESLISEVRQCISDGGIHLRPVLDLPHEEMGAAFFLEVLDAAASAARSERAAEAAKAAAQAKAMAESEAKAAAEMKAAAMAAGEAAAEAKAAVEAAEASLEAATDTDTASAVDATDAFEISEAIEVDPARKLAARKAAKKNAKRASKAKTAKAA